MFLSFFPVDFALKGLEIFVIIKIMYYLYYQNNSWLEKSHD